MAVVHAHCLAFSVSQCVQTLVRFRVAQLEQKVDLKHGHNTGSDSGPLNVNDYWLNYGKTGKG